MEGSRGDLRGGGGQGLLAIGPVGLWTDLPGRRLPADASPRRITLMGREITQNFLRVVVFSELLFAPLLLGTP